MKIIKIKKKYKKIQNKGIKYININMNNNSNINSSSKVGINNNIITSNFIKNDVENQNEKKNRNP